MLALVVAFAMAVAIAGTVVPFLPGVPLAWGAALVYGVVGGFGTVGAVAMVVITVLAVAGTAAGFALPRRAASSAGASSGSLQLGIVLAVVGFFVLPVIGLPLGGALGVYLGERQRTGSHDLAWRATVATAKGFGLAALAQLAATVAIAVTWLAWVLVD